MKREVEKREKLKDSSTFNTGKYFYDCFLAIKMQKARMSLKVDYLKQERNIKDLQQSSCVYCGDTCVVGDTQSIRIAGCRRYALDSRRLAGYFAWAVHCPLNGAKKQRKKRSKHAPLFYLLRINR